MSRTRSMPTWAMSSRRPRNGLMQTAPAFAERSAWVAEKQSVWLTRIPLPERYFTALRPSFVSGHFTTAFGATWASSSPSFTMPSKSVATTSRLTSPGTIAQISSTSGRNGRFSLAISDGLVVTPSTTPSATPSLISPRFAVSRKIFIAPSSGVGSLPLDRHARSRAHLLEDAGVAHDLAHDVHGARRAALVAVAHRRRAEENAEGAARGPVAEVARVDDLAGRLGGRREADAEVDLVAPRLALGLDRKRFPDRARRLRIVQPPSPVAPVVGERDIERCAIRDGRPALPLDGERARARGGGRGLPRVAVALILDEEGRREDVAGAGRVDLSRRPRVNLVPLAVDEQERAVAVGGEDAHRHALEPLDHVVLLTPDVLAAHEQCLDRLQQALRRAPDARHHEAVGGRVTEPSLGRGAHGAVGEQGRDHRVDLVEHGGKQGQRRSPPVVRNVGHGQGVGDGAHVGHAAARILPVLASTRVRRRDADGLD